MVMTCQRWEKNFEQGRNKKEPKGRKRERKTERGRKGKNKIKLVLVGLRKVVKLDKKLN